jgi:FKBP-type peptidyl-prolyl cis-trans isomerase
MPRTSIGKIEIKRRCCHVALCAALPLLLASCKKDEAEDQQRQDIERYITSTLLAKVDVRDGVYYVPIALADSSAARVPVERGHVVKLAYEAWVLRGAMFAASDSAVATAAGLTPLPIDSVEAGMGHLIAGLDRGLLRMAVGEEAWLLFPFSLGYGDEYVGQVPAKSALRFRVTITSVNQKQ